MVRSWQYGLFASGVLVCLIRPLDLLMFKGSILGEKTTGIGMMIWMIGIGILGTFTATLRLGKSKES